MSHNFDEIDEVNNAVLGEKGLTSIELRQAVAAKAAFIAGSEEDSVIPENLRGWVEKVTKYAYKTLDSDIEQLKKAGYSEDEIFEITVAAAHGAARVRFERGLAVIIEAEEASNAS